MGVEEVGTGLVRKFRTDFPVKVILYYIRMHESEWGVGWFLKDPWTPVGVVRSEGVPGFEASTSCNRRRPVRVCV